VWTLQHFADALLSAAQFEHTSAWPDRICCRASAIGRYLTISPTFGLISTSGIAAVLLGIIGSLYPGSSYSSRQTVTGI
jgi:hypothetical protein